MPALVCLWALIIVGAGALPLMLYLKCPSCSKRLMESYYGAHTKWKIDYWAYVVIDVLRRRTFKCMYCGTECFINTERARDCS
jgi:hypothetical protein